MFIFGWLVVDNFKRQFEFQYLVVEYGKVVDKIALVVVVVDNIVGIWSYWDTFAAFVEHDVNCNMETFNFFLFYIIWYKSKLSKYLYDKII